RPARDLPPRHRRRARRVPLQSLLWSLNPLLLLRLVCGLEVTQERVDQRGRLLVVAQALTHDARREVESEGADLGAERDECGLTLRLDLRRSARRDACGLGRRLL